MALSASEQEAKVRYGIRREIARRMSQDRFHALALKGEAPREAITCDFTAITDDALAAAAGWKFPWRRIMGQNRPYLRRFEWAIWQNGSLYGLCVGRASRGSDNVTIHYLERSIGNSPFKGWVGQMAVDSAEIYAKLIVRQRVRIKNPVPEALAVYEKMGFVLEKSYRGSTYCARVVP